MTSCGEVVAAIVVYRPDLHVLERALAAIAPQVLRVAVIINDDGDWACAMPPNAETLRQNANIGLGAAYNVATRWARTQGAACLLLLDQDSVAAPGMVENLARALSADPQAAAAGALWHDRRTGQDGFFVRLSRCGARRVHPQGEEPIAVDFLISSGSLIRLDAIDAIGPFDEPFFIEHIDSDWALRARARHYRLYGVPRARLEHSLGESTRTWFGGRRAFLHAPERQYYLLRNSILLWQRPYAPWRWVLHDVRRIVLLMAYYLLFHAPRAVRFTWMMRAVRDALRAGAPPSEARARTKRRWLFRNET